MVIGTLRAVRIVVSEIITAGVVTAGVIASGIIAPRIVTPGGANSRIVFSVRAVVIGTRIIANARSARPWLA